MFKVFNFCQSADKRTIRTARDLTSATNLARALSNDFHGRFVVQSEKGVVSVWSDGRNVSRHYTGGLPRIKWIDCAQKALA